jgi:hypothetical protein
MSVVGRLGVELSAGLLLPDRTGGSEFCSEVSVTGTHPAGTLAQALTARERRGTALRRRAERTESMASVLGGRRGSGEKRKKAAVDN